MTTTDYDALYRQLATKLHALKEDRSEKEAALGDLKNEIRALEQTLKHLGGLAGIPDFDGLDIDLSNLGITDAVHRVLQYESVGERMSTAQIMDKMKERHFDFSAYSAPDASTRKILNRFVESGKAVIEKEGYKVFYKYQAPEEEDIPF